MTQNFHETKNINDEQTGIDDRTGLSRRKMLQSGVGIAALAGLPGQVANAAHTADNGHPVLGESRRSRSSSAMRVRLDAAQTSLQDFYDVQKTNGDEGLYSDYRGSFTKTLPHDAGGDVDATAYGRLLNALESGENEDFESVPLGGTRKLANPQAAYRFEMVGRDAHNTWMRPAPVILGNETAAEMGELYWKALCRDVPFADFNTHVDISAAISDLNAFSDTVGPKAGGNVTVETIFRGETVGDLTGPYVSQLLFKEIPYGPSTIEQKYSVPVAGSDFMTDTASWLSIQNGDAPLAAPTFGTPRYINDARALGEFVHADFTFQSYLSATLILLGIPGVFDMGNLYATSSTQGAFVTLGGPDVLDLVSKAGNLSLTGAWYQKWLVHRRARPEAYGGMLNAQMTGSKDYGLPDQILLSDGVARTRIENGTSLLPQAYAEGSPTHPSYPAGHATIAGACCTVMKAFFNEAVEIPDPVVPDASGNLLLPYSGVLTVGGEINKLASNIALGRDWAGVHYRSDGIDGLRVGEQQALGLLRDYSRTYNEAFDGFTLTTFDGDSVRIQNGRIY